MVKTAHWLMSSKIILHNRRRITISTTNGVYSGVLITSIIGKSMSKDIGKVRGLNTDNYFVNREINTFMMDEVVIIHPLVRACYTGCGCLFFWLWPLNFYFPNVNFIYTYTTSKTYIS